MRARCQAPRRRPPKLQRRWKQSSGHKQGLDCFVARAPRNDGVRFAPTSRRHCERSEAIQCHAGRLAVSSERVGRTGPAALELLFHSSQHACSRPRQGISAAEQKMIRTPPFLRAVLGFGAGFCASTITGEGYQAMVPLIVATYLQIICLGLPKARPAWGRK
jgi:hypothetical protein